LNSSDKVPDFIALFARVLGALLYALITGWKLTLVFLSVSPFIIIFFNVTVKVRLFTVSFTKFIMSEIVFQIIMKYTIKEIQAFASASSIAQEVLRNIRTVTAFHGQTKEEERSIIISFQLFLRNLFLFYLDSLRI
jgi:ABC-type multidrug transport system fused ATPase/permease subunit